MPVGKLSNVVSMANSVAIDISVTDIQPATAAIYQIDGIVRRASSLQMTADAKFSLNVPQEVNA
jgi:NADH-quinone oxidoreductase subunit G